MTAPLRLSFRLPLYAMLLASLAATVRAADDAAPKPPVYIEADRGSAVEGKSMEASGNVIVRQDGMTVTADHATYQVPQDRLQAGDHITIERDGDKLSGTQLDMQVTAREGTLIDPIYVMAGDTARGDAKKLLFKGQNHYGTESGRFTTCGPESNAWYIHAETMDLDYNTNRGVAWNGWMEFQGVPFFYTPWIDFPLQPERKTGFLIPMAGYRSKTGTSFSAPFYWNIAPNFDATLTPTYMSNRGTMLGGEFRYLQPSFSGMLQGEFIKDRQENGGDNRYGIHFEHQQTLLDDPNFKLSATVEKVSDNFYIDNFSSLTAVKSTTFLPRDVTVSYKGNSWSTYLRWQRYQTLQSLEDPVEEPYDRVPQWFFNANPKIADVVQTNLDAEVTRFSHATKTNGLRSYLYPSLSLPLEDTYGFIKPKIGFHATQYELESPSGDNKKSYSRTLPIFSLDSGLSFERDLQLGDGNYIQTLEPRAYYLYIPYRKQSMLPAFDSAETDFSMTQLFSENWFSGQDRINDANQLSLALTSRLLDSESGAELLRASIGQRFYFKDQEVTLTTAARPNSQTHSDTLVSLGTLLMRNLSTTTDWEYNSYTKATQKFSSGVTWQPEQYKRINLRYVDDKTNDIRQADISGQWPIGGGWYGMARYTYSLQDRRSLDTLLGLEYNAGCWALRLAGRRKTTSTNDYDTSIFIMLEFSGIGGVGVSPMDTVRKSIPGYNDIYPNAPLTK